MSGEGETIVARLFAAIADGDRDAAMRLVHPEVVWTPTVWSSSSTLRGRDAVRGWFDQFGPALEHLEVHAGDIQQVGDRVLALGTVHDSRGGASFATRVGWVFTLDDGMIREGRSHDSWGEAREAVGLPAGKAQPTEPESIRE